MNDALLHNNKVVNNINVLSYNKKEEDKQSLTYQHTNNDKQQIKTSSNGFGGCNNNKHSKIRNEIVGIVINHDKQTKGIVVKPQSANANVNSNVAYSLRNTFKKGNNVVNRKHSSSSSSSTNNPKSCNIVKQQRNQSEQKQFNKKSAVNIPSQKRLLSLGSSQHKKVTSRNVPQITKTSINTNISYANHNHNKHKVNNKGKYIKGSCNSNKKVNEQSSIKTQENILMKQLSRNDNSYNKKEKSLNVYILISGHKINTE